MKLSKRNLDSLGYINFFSGVQNDPDRLRCLTNKLELAHSFASIADDEAN
jgi:NifU-like protein involved in Fe-S cluster formation